MNNNVKNFKIYIFLSTFARNLIEIFIGTILFKKGFSVHQVILFYLLSNIFSLIICVPCIHISKKYSNKLLSLFGIVSFLILQIALNYVNTSQIFLYIIAILFAIYRRCYWISRRYYTLKIIDDKNISNDYALLAIINQIGVITSSYFGSLILEFLNINIITIISIVLLIISIYFIYKLRFDHEKNTSKIQLIETYKSIPVSSVIEIGIYELQNIFKFLFPIYLIIYVKDTYTTIGVVNLIINIATIIFTYLYGRLINKDKNYLKASIIFFVVIKLFQINTYGILLMIVSFMDGFSTKMYEQSFNKEYLILSKRFEYYNYNLMYEVTQNLFRTIVVLFFYITSFDIKVMIYILLIVMCSSLLFDFKTVPSNLNSKVIWKQKNTKFKA